MTHEVTRAPRNGWSSSCSAEARSDHGKDYRLVSPLKKSQAEVTARSDMSVPGIPPLPTRLKIEFAILCLRSSGEEQCAAGAKTCVRTSCCGGTAHHSPSIARRWFAGVSASARNGAVELAQERLQ